MTNFNPETDTYELNGAYTDAAVAAWNDPEFVGNIDRLELHADVYAAHENGGHAGIAFFCELCSDRFRTAAPPTAVVLAELGRRGVLFDMRAPLADRLA